MDAAKRAKAMSVHDRLLSLATIRRRPFDLLVERYALERFLARLGRSGWGESFILKGALVFLVWGVELPRPTRDLDLMGQIANDEGQIREAMREVLAFPMGEDGLWFECDPVRVDRIRESEEYPGFRLGLAARLGTMRLSLRVDIGIGDSIVPAPELVEFPTLLGDEAPIIRAYTRYLVVAEKYETLVKFGAVNTRMKDFFDLWLLAQMFEFDRAILADAIHRTFERRRTPLPPLPPFALTEAYYGDPIIQRYWTGFAVKAGLGTSAPSLADACGSIRQLVFGGE